MPYRLVAFPVRLALLFAALIFASTLPAAGDQATLVRDIETTGEPWELPYGCFIEFCPPLIFHGSQPEQILQVGDQVFFSAFTLEAGRETWVTDGTAEGTHLVADLCPGPCDGSPVFLGGLEGELYLWSSDRDERVGIDWMGGFWRTDGTPEGTRREEKLCEEDCFYQLAGEGALTNAGLNFDGDLLVSAPEAGLEEGYPANIWRIDADAPGTRKLQFRPFPGAELQPVFAIAMGRATRLGEALYLVHEPPYYDDEGEVLLRLDAGAEHASLIVATCGLGSNPRPRSFHGGPGGLAFLSGCLEGPGLDVAPANSALFVTDGTTAGTRLIYDPLEENGERGRVTILGWVDRDLYFAVSGESNSGTVELWRATAGGDVERLFESVPQMRGGAGVMAGRLLLVASLPTGAALLAYEPGTGLPPYELATGGISGLTRHGNILLFAREDEAGREVWVSDGTMGGTRRLLDVNPGPGDSRPGEFTVVGDRVYLAADDGVHDRELMTFPLELAAPGPCVATIDTLCLGEGRFAVRVRFRNQHAAGAQGIASAVKGTPDAGFFWFFRESNLELTVKVLDGTGVNGHHWVFYGGITDLEYDIEVTDLERDLTRTYHHAPGDLCGGADTLAFPATEGAAAVDGLSSTGMQGFLVPMEAEEDLAPTSRAAAPLTPPPCHATDTQLCIGGVFQTYRVEVTYRNQYAGGATGQGQAMPLSEDAGWFWFFNPANPEVMVKVLNGYGVNGHAWVFVGGLSTVEYEVTVTDTSSGGHPTRIFRKPPESTCGFADVTAFPIP